MPLFANLSPVDLKQVASIADEEFFGDGEEIAHEGEVGDVMFIIVSGEVKVCSQQDGQEIEIARRKAGDYVGEMSIIGREPRMASLVAVGDVRTLCIDQKSFQGLIRERPDVSLASDESVEQALEGSLVEKIMWSAGACTCIPAIGLADSQKKDLMKQIRFPSALAALGILLTACLGPTPIPGPDIHTDTLRRTHPHRSRIRVRRQGHMVRVVLHKSREPAFAAGHGRRGWSARGGD